MTRKPKTPPKPFTNDEIFHYFLTELELIVALGKIRWSPEAAQAARHRLDRLSATMNQLALQSKEE